LYPQKNNRHKNEFATAGIYNGPFFFSADNYLSLAVVFQGSQITLKNRNWHPQSSPIEMG
jgi:hypothetical protein